jgi:hypothetical protein
MSNIEYAKKLRRVRKFALENAARWERLAVIENDPLWLEGAADARKHAQEYLERLRELRRAA